MDERLSSAKEALGKAAGLLKEGAGPALQEEAEVLAARIQFALDSLIQNEKKIWLRTKKGREMLGEFESASRDLIELVESRSDADRLRGVVDDVEERAKRLNEEVRRRSMVVT